MRLTQATLGTELIQGGDVGVHVVLIVGVGGIKGKVPLVGGWVVPGQPLRGLALVIHAVKGHHVRQKLEQIRVFLRVDSHLEQGLEDVCQSNKTKSVKSWGGPMGRASTYLTKSPQNCSPIPRSCRLHRGGALG